MGTSKQDENIEVESALLPKVPRIVVTNSKQTAKQAASNNNATLGTANVAVSTQTDPYTPDVPDDPITSAVGDFGKWQFQLTLFLSLLNIPCTWHIFALTFQGASQDFWCSVPDTLNELTVDQWRNISSVSGTPYDPCFVLDLDYSLSYNNLLKASSNVTSVKPCLHWTYDSSLFGDTIIKEWNLICYKFGRKKALMGSLVFQLVLGVLVAVSPWFELFLVVRFFLGFFCVSIVFSGFVLCMELVGGKWLTIMGVMYLFPVPVGYIAISGIAYYSHNWRLLQWVITVPTVLFLTLWWIMPESPRWLVSMGRINEAMEILSDAARFNNRKLPLNLDKQLKDSVLKSNQDVGKKVQVMDLWRTPLIRLISFVQYIIWFSVYLVYYGLVLNLSNIGGDVYVNTIISGIVEFPAIIISIFILLKMGRRRPLCLTTLGAGLACLLTLFFSPGSFITISLAMVGKFAISSSNVIIPIYTAEMFPTKMRNLGVGASSVPAGVALILIPYLWHMQSINTHFPMGLLGVVGVIGGVSVLLLPDTTGLADNLHQLENDIPQTPLVTTPIKKRKLNVWRKVRA
ncbi:hypothetical protein WDU94_004595 [Cyamophila willieti]